MAKLVVTGDSGIPQPSSWDIGQELNAGWTGSISFAENPPLGLAADAIVVLEITDDNSNTLTTPELYLRQRSETEVVGVGESGVYQLIDKTSAILSSGTENFDTFQDSDSVAMGAAIATRFSRSISGIAEFPIWKEDIKQSMGWPPLRRVAVVAGQQILVNNSGAVVFVSNSWNLGASPFIPSQVTRNYNPTDIFGKLYVEKNVGQGTASGEHVYDFTTPGFANQTMDAPLTVVGVYDESTQGKIYNVTFFNAADEKCGSAFFAPGIETDPIVGDWPAVRFSAVVEPSTVTSQTQVRLRITGSPPNPPPAGIDPAISWTYGAGRGYPQPFSESLIPSLDWADDHWPDWLIELNRGGSHQLVAESKLLQCNVAIGQTFTRFGQTGRIERVRFAGSANNYTTSIMAEVF